MNKQTCWLLVGLSVLLALGASLIAGCSAPAPTQAPAPAEGDHGLHRAEGVQALRARCRHGGMPYRL